VILTPVEGEPATGMHMFDDAHGKMALLEDGTLLDVELEIGTEGREAGPGPR